MSVFKCKMCGGSIEFEPGTTVGICDSCGTKQTLPRLDGEKKANLYDRANHFRRNNEYDKASGIYEQILNEDSTDAEVYWSLVLCRYGIEYVEDPVTHKQIPTINRTQFTSIFADEDYKSALQYADGSQRRIYEDEAKAIDGIQKGILAISQKEEPFDVFICYKESDNSGRRTQDSVLANDLYHQLTQEGFKVFFSRITLEDKLGTAYEPYIFAALNSAKVMVVLGTKPEYFNAVWVKNEWSRYMALIRNGAKKVLIPAYRDMDPYDLPEEFSHLQAQDMAKLGFMQDLIRGIKKITAEEPTTRSGINEAIVNSGAVNTSPLLERAFMFLDDCNWDSADKYCEKVLDIDPKNVQAYLGKLMAEFHVNIQERLEYSEKPFDESSNYLRVMQFGSETLKRKLEQCNEEVKKRCQEEQEYLLRAKCTKLEGLKKIQEIRKRLNDPDCSVMVAISEDGHVAAISADGTVQTCGMPLDGWDNPYPPEDWHDLVYIDLGYNNVAGLRSDGTVVAYGADSESSFGNSKSISEDTLSWKNVTAISIGGHVLSGLCYDGNVLACGEGNFDLCEVSAWNNVIQICSNSDAIFGLCENGKVKYCGKRTAIPYILGAYRIKSLESGLAVFYPNKVEIVSGEGNEIMEGTSSWSNIADVVGNWHRMAAGLKRDGTIVTSKTSIYYEDNDNDGELERWKDIVELRHGYQSSVGLKSDGTVVSCGAKSSGTRDISGWKDIVSIKMTEHAFVTIGICADGSVVSCGQVPYAENNGIKIDTSGIKLFNSIEDLDKNIARNKAKRLAIEAEIATELERQKEALQAEAANIKGLFAYIKKSKLEAKIAEIDRKLNIMDHG